MRTALSSIGYRSLPLEGLPFDERAGIIPNTIGRVLGLRGSVYCAGWVKRGPSGIIGTNIVDAKGTVSAMVEDFHQGYLSASEFSEKSGWEGLPKEARDKAVDWDAFQRIDAAEVQRGASRNKVREKFTNTHEMLVASRGRNNFL